MLVFGLAGSQAGASSSVASMHRWTECPRETHPNFAGGVLCATENGGRTWRPIFYGGNYIHSAVRTSPDTGVVSTGAYGSGEWWTRDNGLHWYPTSVIGEPTTYAGPGPRVTGSDDRLYWAMSPGSTIYQVEGWPPTGKLVCNGTWVNSVKEARPGGDWSKRRNICWGRAVDAGMRSTPVLHVDDARLFSHPAQLPTGIAAAFDRDDNLGKRLAIRDGEEIRVHEIPKPHGKDEVSYGSELLVSWPRLSLRVVWAVSDWGDSVQAEYRSSDGGRTFSIIIQPGWAWRRPLPTQRTAAASVVRGGKVLLIGGRVGNAWARSFAAVSGRVDTFDPTTGEWRLLPRLPVRVSYPMAASDGNRIYVVGGFDRRRRPQRHAFVFESGRWRALPRPPGARAAGGSALLGGKLYVLGGVSGSGLSRDMHVFDLRTRRWSAARGPSRRAYIGVAPVQGRIVAVGGRTGGVGTHTDLAESFDPGRRQWSALPPVPEPVSEAAAVEIDGHFVSIGGLSGDSYSSSPSVYTFGPATRQWTRLPDLPRYRHGLAAGAVGGHLYALGGTVSGERIAGTTYNLVLEWRNAFAAN